MVPALFAFVLSSLDNIQADLEDPFDGIGVDDMVINAEIFERSLDLEKSDQLQDLIDPNYEGQNYDDIEEEDEYSFIQQVV